MTTNITISLLMHANRLEATAELMRSAAKALASKRHTRHRHSADTPDDDMGHAFEDFPGMSPARGAIEMAAREQASREEQGRTRELLDDMASAAIGVRSPDLEHKPLGPMPGALKETLSSFERSAEDADRIRRAMGRQMDLSTTSEPEGTNEPADDDEGYEDPPVNCGFGLAGLYGDTRAERDGLIELRRWAFQMVLKAAENCPLPKSMPKLIVAAEDLEDYVLGHRSDGEGGTDPEDIHGAAMEKLDAKLPDVSREPNAWWGNLNYTAVPDIEKGAKRMADLYRTWAGAHARMRRLVSSGPIGPAQIDGPSMEDQVRAGMKDQADPVRGVHPDDIRRG